MLYRHSIIHVLLLLALASRALATSTLLAKRDEGVAIASATMIDLYTIFGRCLYSSMPDQHFLADDLKSFVNYPSRTTVGFAPKYTGNRKFFANMIGTTVFREMLEKDEEELRINLIKKIKYCDEAIMDQNILKDFYDREVDQSKI